MKIFSEMEIAKAIFALQHKEEIYRFAEISTAIHSPSDVHRIAKVTSALWNDSKYLKDRSLAEDWAKIIYVQGKEPEAPKPKAPEPKAPEPSRAITNPSPSPYAPAPSGIAGYQGLDTIVSSQDLPTARPDQRYPWGVPSGYQRDNGLYGVPKGYNYRNAEPERCAMFVLGFPVIVVEPGVTARIVTTPQLPFRPSELFIENEVARLFDIVDLRVGHNSSLLSDLSVPASIASIWELGADTCNVGQQISISVKNKSHQSAVFQCALLGTGLQ